MELSLPPTVATATSSARRDLALVGDLLAGWAPGRVNLIGEHTDYNDGFVLPIAIERTVALVGKLAEDPADMAVQLFSVHHNATATFSASDPPTADAPGDVPLWARYVAGAVSEARAAGVPVRGFRAAIAGDVPLGAGLSSSAALIQATLIWLDAALGLHLAPMERARIGQRAETRGSGVRVGILDHAASALGRPGFAVCIDCRALTYAYFPFTFANTALLVCETGVERSLTTVGYNGRRSECEAAARIFADLLANEGRTGVRSLRDMEQHDYRRLAGGVPEPLRRRARHVISENDRVMNAQIALEVQNAAGLAIYVMESHASLRDDFEVSSPELEAVVRIATRRDWHIGARLLGAGFGGSVLIVTPTKRQAAIQADLAQEYRTPAGTPPIIHAVTPAGGPGTAPVVG
jgi:galactokinase